MKRVCIFHISEFGGHNKAGHNLSEAFRYKNPQIDVMNLNGLGYFYPRSERVVDFFYIAVIKYFPNLWGKAYDRKKVFTAIEPARRFVHKIAFSKLDKFINEHKPDCFVATQAFPCGLVADFKRKNKLKVPLVAVVTDYHPHRFWVDPAVDIYIVACAQAKDALIKEGVAPEKIRLLGIPISVQFLTSYPRQETVGELNLRKDLNSVLIMGGGLGLGPIKHIAKELDNLNQDFQIIAVCGRNKKLYNWFLRNGRKFKKPMSVFAYTDHIHKLMDFSDIIITKGGGITISEALAKGLCIVVTGSIPGQEERNVKYLSEKDVLINAATVEDVSAAVEGLLKRKKEMYALKERAKASSFIDSSLRIVDCISELIY